MRYRWHQPTTSCVLTLCLALCTALTGHLALAHREQYVWTTISVSRDGGSLEIVHRLHAHDALQYLEQITGAPVDIGADRPQAQFALSLAEQFAIHINGTAASPELLGAELDGNNLLVYQELPIAETATRIDLTSKVMMDVFPEQTHLVDISLGGDKTTLTISRTTESATWKLQSASTH